MVEQRTENPCVAGSIPAPATTKKLFPRGNSAFVAEFRGRVKSGHDVCRLKRMPINAMDTLALFKAKLQGGYDWAPLGRSFHHRPKRDSKDKAES